MFLDTFHTLSTVWMLWDFTVDNFGNMNVFAHLPWAYPSTPIFIVRLAIPLFHSASVDSHPPLFGLGAVSIPTSAPLRPVDRSALGADIRLMWAGGLIN